MADPLRIADLAWVAGIVDLKGRVRRIPNKQRKGRPQLFMYVETKESAVVRRLCRLTGNKMEINESFEFDSVGGFEFDGKEIVRRGCIEHCPESHIHVSKTMPRVDRWSVSGAVAGVVIFNIMPYLVTDKGYDGLLLEIIEAAPKGERDQGRHAIDRSLTRMEELGWSIPNTLRTTEYLETNALNAGKKSAVKAAKVAKTAKSRARRTP